MTVPSGAILRSSTYSPPTGACTSPVRFSWSGHEHFKAGNDGVLLPGLALRGTQPNIVLALNPALRRDFQSSLLSSISHDVLVLLSMRIVYSGNLDKASGVQIGLRPIRSTGGVACQKRQCRATRVGGAGTRGCPGLSSLRRRARSAKARIGIRHGCEKLVLEGRKRSYGDASVESPPC
jgi:hypothetical protein